MAVNLVTVTGNLETLVGGTPYLGRLWFRLNRADWNGTGQIFAPEYIEATGDPTTGAFSVALQSTDNLEAGAYYTAILRYREVLDGKDREYIIAPFSVPTGGPHLLADLFIADTAAVWPTNLNYATMADFIYAVNSGFSMTDGHAVIVAGISYIADSASAIAGIPAGWRPAQRIWTEAELIATTDPVSPGVEIIEVNVADEIIFYRREPGAAGPDDIQAGDGSDWAKASLTTADLLGAVTDVTTAAEFITYAAGQFTPVLTAATPGTMSVSGGTTRGSYTRIGNRVFVDIAFVGVTVSLGTASGEIIISGLPYAAAANTYGHGQLRRADGVDIQDASSGVPANVSYRVAPSDTKGRIFIIPANANAFSAPVARLGATVTLEIVGSYEVLP